MTPLAKTGQGLCQSETKGIKMAKREPRRYRRKERSRREEIEAVDIVPRGRLEMKSNDQTEPLTSSIKSSFRSPLVARISKESPAWGSKKKSLGTLQAVQCASPAPRVHQKPGKSSILGDAKSTTQAGNKSKAGGITSRRRPHPEEEGLERPVGLHLIGPE
jgi:hypothetical protein